ncbi:MAG TPA: hypothetical protein VGX03_26535 [Candidatus Binatia bacterium]|jgi:tryptophanyl-tRNA synthetase|nr:hypothetical protein [Candidatus Binatia bacterium]
MKKRIFSGIQPTGHLHLDNYLGAVRQWVALQEEYACLFCIADLHAITTFQEPARLQATIREVAALLVAAGIDPARSPLFVQSHVSAHAELAWLLTCVIPMGWLQRMTQYKSKAAQGQPHVSVGLFAYPALMAADLLLYAPQYVQMPAEGREMGVGPLSRPLCG